MPRVHGTKHSRPREDTATLLAAHDFSLSLEPQGNDRWRARDEFAQPRHPMSPLTTDPEMQRRFVPRRLTGLPAHRAVSTSGRINSTWQIQLDTALIHWRIGECAAHHYAFTGTARQPGIVPEMARFCPVRPLEWCINESDETKNASHVLFLLTRLSCIYLLFDNGTTTQW